MVLASLCLHSSQCVPNNPTCPHDYPSVCALCRRGHVLVTATLFALSRMRVIRVTNKLRLYFSRFGNVRGKRNVQKVLQTILRHDMAEIEMKARLLNITVRANGYMRMVHSLIMKLLCACQTNRQPSSSSLSPYIRPFL